MHSSMQYLIGNIISYIPKEILELAFQPQLTLNQLNNSLEWKIQEEVIRNRVLKDCDMVAGIETTIDITSCRADWVNMGMVYHIGLGPTAGRTITSVLSVGYSYNAMAGGQPGIASALTEPLQTSDARIQLVGHNVVYVEGYIGVRLTNMKVVLQNDENFNNVNTRNLRLLADMCLNACKAIIFNKFNVSLGSAIVLRGVDMPKIQSIVDGYSDAEEKYKELLDTKWYKANMFGDRVTLNRMIRRMVPS